MYRQPLPQAPRLIMALIPMLTLGCGMSVAIADDTTKTASPQSTVVEVSGTGPDVEAAKKDAYREAVRQVVGAYTTSKTRTENDELIEDKIIALSSGLVEDAETLNVGSQDDLVRVRMRCTVRVTKVIDRLKSNKIAVKKVDGQSLGAELLGKTDQEKGIDELLREAFDGFPGAWFTAEVDGKPRLGDRTPSGDRELFVTIDIAADLDAYPSAAARLVEALKADGTPMREFDLDGSRCGPRRGGQDQENAAHSLRDLVSGATIRQVGCLDIARGLSDDLAAAIHDGKVIVFPVKFYSGGKRSRWVSCQLSDQQRERLDRASGRPKMPGMRCKTTLLDADHEPIAVNDTVLGGPKDPPYWGPLLGMDYRIIAPAFIESLAGDGIVVVPKFGIECRFDLSEAEVESIDSIETTIEALGSF